MNTNWVVILNTNACRGKAEKKWLRIERILRQMKIKFSLEKMHVLTQLDQKINDLLRHGNRHFLIVGGDGTLHYWVNALMNQVICESIEITNALIPIGTGNDWYKSMYGSSSIRRIARGLLANQTHLVDLGKAEVNNGRPIYFMNMLSIGFSAHVVDGLVKQKNWALGRFVYVIEAIRSLSKYNAQEASLCVGEKCIMDHLFAIQIGIGQYAGGGLVLAPKASPTDGLFTIMVIPEMSKLKIIRHLWRLYHGSIDKVAEVLLLSGSKVELCGLNEERLPVESDGEFMGFGSVNVVILPARLKILTLP